MQPRRLLSLALLAIFIFPGAANAHRNIALVIANSHYESGAWPALRNTISDAALISRKMKAAGFDLDEPPAVDLDIAQLRARLQRFATRVDTLPPDTIVWIYYSGHGMQVNGTNYIVPLKAPDPRDVIEHMDDAAEHLLADRFISLNEILLAFGSHRRSSDVDNANVLILDACRDNPFQKRGSSRFPRGLAETPETANTLIAYAASPGATADDGPLNGNSPYAAAFANAMSQGYLPLELIFNQVGGEVLRSTNRLQRPDYRAGIFGFYCIIQCSIVDASTYSNDGRSATQNTVSGNCDLCISEQALRTPDGKSLWVSRTVLNLGLWQKCQAVLSCPTRQLKAQESESSAITGVSWSDIAGFLSWLNNNTGKRYRLPTTDEWTMIYKNGRPVHGTKESVLSISSDSKLAGILVDEGLSEWTSSCDAAGAGSGGACEYRLVRGHSWEEANVADRLSSDSFPVSARGDALGFRVVRDQ